MNSYTNENLQTPPARDHIDFERRETMSRTLSTPAGLSRRGGGVLVRVETFHAPLQGSNLANVRYFSNSDIVSLDTVPL